MLYDFCGACNSKNLSFFITEQESRRTCEDIVKTIQSSADT